MSGSIQAYQRQADQQRRDDLILSHLSLVKHVIGRLIGELPHTVDVENLESAGVLGLVEAASKYDPTRNTLFKTFAYMRIRGAILDELRRNSPLPQHVLERVSIIRKAYQKLPQPVTVEAIAEATGMSVDEVSDVLAAERFSKTVSWDGVVDTDGMSHAVHEDTPDLEAERWEAIRRLTDAIESLPPKERIAVTLYYREELRLKEISEIMKLSPSRISRLLSKALFDLGEIIKARDSSMNKSECRISQIRPQTEVPREPILTNMPATAIH